MSRALEKRGVLHIAKMVNLFAKMAPLALARKFAGNFLIVMRSFFLIFFLALFFSPAQAEQMTCLVVGVTDGDTIKVRCGQPGAYEQIKVRFGAIDAPESKQAFGQRSKQALSDLIYMKQAQLNCYKQDRYKRNICTVSTSAAGDVGLAMIRQGMAWWYRDYAREQSADARKRYEQAEQHAMKEKRGLWSDPHAMPPWEWRRERRKK